MKLTVNEAARWLLDNDGYIVLTHIRPDGDTLGSGAALVRGLQQLGKQAYLAVNPGVTPRFIGYVGKYFAPADFAPAHIVSVDIASEELFHETYAPMRGRVELAIDHHGSNTFFAKDVLVEPETAACGQVMLKVLDAMHVPIDPETASLLYIAVSTDTGCFSFGNTTAETLTAAARLVELGAEHRAINKLFFRTRSRIRMELEGRILTGMRFYRNGTIAAVVISNQLIRELGADEDIMDNISSIPVEIEGVDAGVTVRELAPGKSKISLRTTDAVNAGSVCALFGGGGHAQAAGCTISAQPEEAAKMMVEALEKHWA